MVYFREMTNAVARFIDTVFYTFFCLSSIGRLFVLAAGFSVIQEKAKASIQTGITPSILPYVHSLITTRAFLSQNTLLRV